MQIASKACTKCGAEKELTFFDKKKGSSDGRRSRCKTCRAILRQVPGNKKRMQKWKKRYYEKHKIGLAEVSKTYRCANKEKLAEKAKMYYSANKEAICKNVAKWKKENPKKASAATRRYRHAHLELERKRSRDYAKEHRIEYAMRLREWRKSNPVKYKNSNLKNNDRRTKMLYDGYVKGVLCCDSILEPSDIPVELIVVKREQMRLHRELKKQAS